MTTAINTRASLKQPEGLSSLFFIELWERFGFYCVQALLVLFLTKAYHFTDTQSYDLFSAFSALIYATPVIGGYLADKVLGFRRAVVFGGILYVIGYFLLATTNKNLFYLSLSLLICANGFFKSCVSSLLGTLYESNDPRRDSGFTWFYMGINIGSFLSPIICTWAADTYGWGYGFGLAGVGMLCGMFVARISFKKLATKLVVLQEQKPLNNKTKFGVSIRTLLILGTVLAIGLFSLLIQYSHATNIAFDIFCAVTALAIIVLAFRYPQQQRNKMLVLITLMLFSLAFWAVYDQTFTSLTLFTDKVVDRQFFGWTIPTAMFQSVNPFFIMILSPPLAYLWVRLSKSRWNLSTPGKFTIAMFLMSAGFLVLPIGIHFAAQTGLVSMTWLNFNYFLQTCGELCLSPIGLSMVTALAPVEITGMMMGAWFLFIAGAYAVGDYLADKTAIPSNVTDPVTMGHIYGHVYNELGWATFGVAVLLLLLTPKLKRLMGEGISAQVIDKESMAVSN